MLRVGGRWCHCSKLENVLSLFLCTGVVDVFKCFKGDNLSGVEAALFNCKRRVELGERMVILDVVFYLGNSHCTYVHTLCARN